MTGFYAKDVDDALDFADRYCRLPVLYVVERGDSYLVVPAGMHGALPDHTRLVAVVYGRGVGQIPMVERWNGTLAEHAAMCAAKTHELLRRHGVRGAEPEAGT